MAYAMKMSEECSMFQKSRLRLFLTLRTWLLQNQRFLNTRISETDFAVEVYAMKPPCTRIAADVTCKLCYPPKRIKLQGLLKSNGYSWIASSLYRHLRIKHCIPELMEKVGLTLEKEPCL